MLVHCGEDLRKMRNYCGRLCVNLSKKHFSIGAKRDFPRFPQSMRERSKRETRVVAVLYETFHVSTAVIITTSFMVN
jgi:hypothetical protein